MGDQVRGAAAPRPELSIALINWAAHTPPDWTFLIERAVAVERAGIDKVVASDHVVFGEDLDAYAKPELGGTKGGRQPTGPDGCWPEPLTTLAVIAGATSRLRLSTGILLAALRRPTVLAKTAATLDALSGGRLELGVGVGWQREEYEAAGLDFAGRGRLLDHTLEVCRTLWTEQRATYESPELSFDGIHLMPKPVPPGGVPIWVSGTLNRHVLARLARFGAGWIPWGPSMDDLGASIRQMRQGVAALGRDPADIGVVGSVLAIPDEHGAVDADAVMAGVPQLVDIGVTDVRIFMPVPPPRPALDDILGDLVEAFRLRC
jgi:probable F420-dependent oxidoreductase